MTEPVTELVSLAKVKAYLKIPPNNVDSDDELQDAIDTATKVVESYVGAVIQKSVSETYDAPCGHGLALRSGPVLDVTEVIESGGALGVGVDCKLDDSGVLHRIAGYVYRPWLPGALNIAVTYTVGVVEVPANLATAVKELVRINFRHELGGDYSPFDGGKDDDYAATGDQIRLGFFVPGRVLQLLEPDLTADGFA